MHMNAGDWNRLMKQETRKMDRFEKMKSAMEKRHAQTKARRESAKAERAGTAAGCSQVRDAATARQLLGLSLDGQISRSDVKRAFMAIARVQHPDKLSNPTEEDQERFSLTIEAYDFLNAMLEA